MRDALTEAAVAWRDLGVLVAWAGAGTALTARTFKWE
jgi:ABC-2 type transport system permease protein